MPAWTRHSARLLLLVAVIAGALWTANRPAYAADITFEAAAYTNSAMPVGRNARHVVRAPRGGQA